MQYSYVYILASGKNGTLYVGVTNNLERRLYEHKTKQFKGFTEKYNVCDLVYFAFFDRIDDAISYEKRLKKWHRSWKIRLIEKHNPDWKDLSNTWYSGGFPPARE